ncbi:hypothetical protein ES703_79125 [subsurface metagenome]
MRHSRIAFNGSDERRFLTTDEGSRTLKQLDIKTEITSQDISAQEFQFLSLTKGNLDPMHSQRIFGTNIDIAITGTNGIGSDNHSLQYRVGVTLQDSAVHKGTRVTLIAVAYHIFGSPPGMAADFPLFPGRKASTTPPPQPGLFNPIYNFLRRRPKHLYQRLIAAVSNVVLYLLRVDITAVFKYNLFLIFSPGEFGKAGDKLIFLQSRKDKLKARIITKDKFLD